MSFFDAPIAPLKDAGGKTVRHATIVPRATVTLEQVYRVIPGSEWLRRITVQVREADDLRIAKASLLPYVTPCGVFGRRSGDHLTELSGVFPIDIDHLDTEREARELCRRLFNDPVLHPVLCFVSPGGRGVKAFVPCHLTDRTPDPVGHAVESIRWAMHYVQAIYGAADAPAGKGVDPSGKDLARACFLSHDPEALMRSFINN